MILFFPWLVARTCLVCRMWQFEDDGERLSGEISRRPHRTGLPMRRRPGAKTPCNVCPKIPFPDNTPEKVQENAIELSDRNRLCVAHWLEAREVGFEPHERADPWVRRHARILRTVQDEFDREPMDKMTAYLMALRMTRGR